MRFHLFNTGLKDLYTLLFGDNYVSDPKVGKICHRKRVAFETNLRKLGKNKELKIFYKAMAKLNLGRQVIVYATRQ